MYADEPFFTLSPGAQVGLLALSAVLAAALLWLVWRLALRQRWPTRALIALGVWVVFAWAAPQVYAAFGWLMAGDLPLRWAIRWPPDLGAILAEFTFTAPSSLAAHGRGVLGWVSIAVALVTGRFRPPVRHH